ncbi:MAG: SRPBCC domain-containing protein [Ignavibacteria bacterium]
MPKKKLNVSIFINAPKEKIWSVLLDDETYRKWTTPFMEGSYADGNWEEGSKMYFKGPSGEGMQGMVSRIKLHKPNDVITIEHLGILKDNTEDYESKEAKKWGGSDETYRLESKDSGNMLYIEMDIDEEYLEWFTATWQKAIEKVKELSEN